jgi:hypothetical protein
MRLGSTQYLLFHRCPKAVGRTTEKPSPEAAPTPRFNCAKACRSKVMWVQEWKQGKLFPLHLAWQFLRPLCLISLVCLLFPGFSLFPMQLLASNNPIVGTQVSSTIPLPPAVIPKNVDNNKGPIVYTERSMHVQFLILHACIMCIS